MPGVDWVEAVAENLCSGHLPGSLLRLRERGVTVVPHGVSLGLGGAERPDPERLARLASVAGALGSPLVTEHIAFVRAGGGLTASPALEAGHLLPVPRTRDALDVLCANVRIAQDALPVPLAVENIAALISWPHEEMTEGQFLYDLVDRTGVRLLIDVANLHTNHVNRGEDPVRALDELPVEAIAYVHVAGGVERDGVWHDSHAHPVPGAVLDVLAELASRVDPPGVLLERDEDFPAPEELARELTAIRSAVSRARRTTPPGSAAPSPAVRSTGPTRPAHPVRLTRPTRPPKTAPHRTDLDGTTQDRTAPTARTGTSTGTAADGPVRQRVALAQTALLSALVAGTPVPEGFDGARISVQSRALLAKRASVVAKVAPELRVILGTSYRAEFLAYAHRRPMTAGYRHDALGFAAHLLRAGRPHDARTRRELTGWWVDRSGPRPPSRLPWARAARAVRIARALRSPGTVR
ncbi:multinuclear nonheme iron-dependent oxidase [Streptomyces sp. JNUCC 64]